MKPAEALLLRADLRAKLGSLRERVGRYALKRHPSPPHAAALRL